MADDITRTLHQMLADKAGEGEYALHLAKKYGVQVLSGIKGLSVLPQGMDAAADAVREYQEKYGPGMDLSPNGAGFIRYEVAPVYRSIKNSPVGAANSAISNSYDEGSQELSDLAGKYFGPTAAGVVGAAADAAPYMAVTEDGLLGAPKSAMPAAELSDLVARYAPERAYDNSTMHTLANEQWAAQNAKPAYTKATIPTSQLDPSLHPANFTPPDNAQSVVAMDPVTGKQVAHVTYVKRGDGVQSLRMDTDPLWRGNGIAPDLLKDAVSNAHDMGLPYRSDTQVSVPAAKTYEKLPGAVRNEDVTHTRDDTDGDVGFSNNGRPVYEIPRMPDADDATPDELPQFDPNSWIRSQAYAEGGEVAPLLEDLAAMVAKYADAPHLKGIPAGGGYEGIASAVNAGGDTVHPGTLSRPSQGFSVSRPEFQEILDHPITGSQVGDYIGRHADVFGSDPTAHFGGWHNKGDGKVYLDVSHVHADPAEAMARARAGNQIAIYDLGKGEEIPNPDYQPMMDFAHYSNLDTPTALLDPAYYGTGIKGAESARGGTKTISLYPHDIAQPEPGLEHKTKYRVSVPADQMYDMSSDPLGLRANAPSYSDAEDAVREAGFLGYHVPEGQGIFRGQARMFGPTPAVRISAGDAPGSAISAEPVRGSVATKKTPPSANDSGIYDDTADTGDFADGGPVKMAEGGELAPVLDDIGALVAKYAEGAPNDHAAQLAKAVKTDGGVTYNPTTGDVHTSGYAVPSEPSRSVALDSAPSASDIHDFMLQNQDAFDNPKAALHIESDEGGNHFMHVAHIEPTFDDAMTAARQFGVPGVRELHTGINIPTSTPVENTSQALSAYGVPTDMVRSIRTSEKGDTIPAAIIDQALAHRSKYNAEPPVTPGPQASDQEWADFGKQHGVNMTLTPSQEVHPGINIPGGLDGEFTIPDLFQLKAQNFNPNDMPRDMHDALMQKVMRTYSADKRTDVDNFNALNFGLLSPNSPLLGNEFSAQRMRVRTPQDIHDLANSTDDLVERYGLQSAGKGGMGIRGTADPNNSRALAQAMLDNPNMTTINPGETMQDAMLRVANSAPGHSIKTASLSVPFTDLANANTSAVDLHMIRNHWQDLMSDPQLGDEFKERVAGLFGVKPTPEAIKAAYDANPGQGMETVRSVIEGHPTRLFRLKNGDINPSVPSALLPDKMPNSPERFTTPSPFYQQIVNQVNDSRQGLPLFPEQWRLWDTYRQRFEPHEFAHPDWKNLPKQSFSEMQRALNANKAAGFAGKNVPLQNNSGMTWKDLYYGHAEPLLLGAIAGAGALGAAGYALSNQED